jgi:predicted transposase/invertase (TIGR01784 family)
MQEQPHGEREDTSKAFLTAKSDIVFKLFFGNERNRDFLIRFLKAVLNLSLEEYTDIEINDPQTKREFKGDKLAILDVKIKTKTGKIVNIEIQVHVTPEMRERIVFYDAKLITEQLGSGDEYADIKKVISIVITGEVFIPEHDRYHDRFIFFSPETKTEFTDVMEIHTLELPKLPEKPDGTDLWDWLEFINAESEEELAVLVQNSPQMKAPIEKLIELNQDPTARMLFEAREKERRDNMARERGARQEGRREGRLETMIEIARNLMGRKMPMDDIMGITGLTAEEINGLRLN